MIRMIIGIVAMLSVPGTHVQVADSANTNASQPDLGVAYENEIRLTESGRGSNRDIVSGCVAPPSTRT